MTTLGEALWSVRQLPSGAFIQVGKATNIEYEVPLGMGSEVDKTLEEQESRYCHACHAVERP